MENVEFKLLVFGFVLVVLSRWPNDESDSLIGLTFLGASIVVTIVILKALDISEKILEKLIDLF